MAKKSDIIVKVIYNSAAGFWQGVPARDLTPDEWTAIDAETRKTLVTLGLYTEVHEVNKEGE